MHFLSALYRSEFLACPELVRFDYASGQEGPEPTLLIKANTLLLKYITSSVRMQLAFARLDDRVLYGVKVHDDADHPAFLWSVLEHEPEKLAIAALLRGEPCQVFLFNELAVNVAWASVPIVSLDASLSEMLSVAAIGRIDDALIRVGAGVLIDSLVDGSSSDNFIAVDLGPADEWNEINSHFITSHATSNLINLFDPDEGRQQEHIGVWLTDNLHPQGVHHSPQIPKGKGRRELTDILMSYELGSMLIESKALTIFARDGLPSRGKLSKDVTSHLNKAVAQLRGGIRKLKAGTSVFSLSGSELEIERSQPMHGIVLVPDMDLVEEESVSGGVIEDFMRATGGFLHLLDPAELLRMVQAAEQIASRGIDITPMMAFDHYLIERAKRTVDAGSLRIEVLLRFADPTEGSEEPTGG